MDKQAYFTTAEDRETHKITCAKQLTYNATNSMKTNNSHTYARIWKKSK